MGTLAIVTNPPISGAVKYVGYRHADDGHLYEHEFGDGVRMKAMRDGSLKITHGDGRTLHRDFSGQRFLVNPPQGGRKMARRAQPRHRSGPLKGKFKARGSSTPKRKRSNPPAKRKAAARRAPAKKSPARRKARRNPPIPTLRQVGRDLTTGAMDAGLVLTGKAAVRTIPTLVDGIPKSGNLGLATQALTAVVVSILGRNFLKPAQAKMLLAGGLSAPIETLLVSWDAPFFAAALQPTEGDAQLSAYMHGYVQQPEWETLEPGATMNGYVQEDGIGEYFGDETEVWS